MGRILIGVFFIVGGLSGTMVLSATKTSGALALLGGVLVVFGLVDETTGRRSRPTEPAKTVRKPVVPSAMLGMLVFIVTEVMLFAGFISAYTISRANAPEGLWPPPGQPRLPAEATMVNTAVLLASGALLFFAYRRFRAEPKGAVWPFLVAVVLGAAFVALQGREWVALLAQGLTLTSSPSAAFFYLIVGAHAAHALFAVAALGVGWLRLRREALSKDFFLAALCFWTFVVGMWPVIYLRVYF